MKILMVHAWYRGDSWRFWKTYKVTRFRFRYILTFSMLATIAHSFKTIKKILKGQWGPRTPKETMKLMKKVKPVDMETMDRKKKRKMSIWERMFQYINYYTLYSIAIENKNYFRGLIRSMHITLKNIPDLFVKKSHVNLVFRLMEYSMTFTNGLVGAIVGAALANYYGLSDHIAYAAAGGCVLFLWIGGSSTVLILNDLNMSYKTIMYIHTVDMLIDKKGYTRFELENPLSEKEMELLESEYNEKAKKKDEKKRRADKMEEN